MKRDLILYISGLLVIVYGCKGFEKVVKSSDYMLKYNEAKRYYTEEDYYRAQVLFDQIAPVFRGAEQADTVYYYQAMCYYKQSEYIMAGHYFQNFSNTYGGSPFVEEADFMTAYCYYKNSPRAELDQENTQMAIQFFQLFILKYKESERVQEAEKYINQLREKLVEKSFISAKLYYDLDDYKASIVALNNSLSEFPESKYREDIMFMLLESSYKLAFNSIESKKKERFQSTIDEYYSFKAEFPNSGHQREAERYYRLSVKYLGDDYNEDEESEIN